MTSKARSSWSSPAVFQTNKYLAGGSLFGNVPDAFIADPQTTGTNGTILVTVNPSATSYTVSYGTTVRNFSVKAPPLVSVVIESLLPDPVGDDRELEEVTLKNKGTAAVPLTGWMLRDRSGLTWTLTGLGTLTSGHPRPSGEMAWR